MPGWIASGTSAVLEVRPQRLVRLVLQAGECPSKCSGRRHTPRKPSSSTQRRASRERVAGVGHRQRARRRSERAGSCAQYSATQSLIARHSASAGSRSVTPWIISPYVGYSAAAGCGRWPCRRGGDRARCRRARQSGASVTVRGLARARHRLAARRGSGTRCGRCTRSGNGRRTARRVARTPRNSAGSSVVHIAAGSTTWPSASNTHGGSSAAAQRRRGVVAVTSVRPWRRPGAPPVPGGGR